MVVPSDKGKSVVVMYKHEYDSKVSELLTEKNIYTALQGDPTNGLQINNNKMVKELQSLKLIDRKEQFALTTYNAVAPKLYALPKVHKPNIPLRPIVASINTPSSALSKKLSNMLKILLVDDAYNIKNSFDFKTKVSGMIVDGEEMLVSYDIVSLFTNIPVYLAIDIIGEQWDRISETTNIPKKLFFKMLHFCLLDANYFIYNSVCYRQTHGMPMGNPLSTVIADIVTKVTKNGIGESPVCTKNVY